MPLIAIQQLLKEIWDDSEIYISLTPCSVTIREEKIDPYISIEDRVADLQSTVYDMKEELREDIDYIASQLSFRPFLPTSPPPTLNTR